MQKVYIKGYKQHQYCTDIFKLRIFNFMFRWFIDCGEWFVYFYFNKLSVRLSGAGNMIEKYTEEEYIKWLNDHHNWNSENEI